MIDKFRKLLYVDFWVLTKEVAIDE